MPHDRLRQCGNIGVGPGRRLYHGVANRCRGLNQQLTGGKYFFPAECLPDLLFLQERRVFAQRVGKVQHLPIGDDTAARGGEVIIPSRCIPDRGLDIGGLIEVVEPDVAGPIDQSVVGWSKAGVWSCGSFTSALTPASCRPSAASALSNAVLY